MKPEVIVEAVVTNRTLESGDKVYEYQKGDLGYVIWRQCDTRRPRMEFYIVWDKDPKRFPRRTLFDNVTVVGLQKGDCRVFVKFDL